MRVPQYKGHWDQTQQEYRVRIGFVNWNKVSGRKPEISESTERASLKSEIAPKASQRRRQGQEVLRIQRTVPDKTKQNTAPKTDETRRTLPLLF